MIISSVIPALIFYLFYLASKKELWNFKNSSIFECGYSSYFFSRFSFSSHYFLVGLIFLFLDLELCLLFPFLSLPSSSPFCLTYGWLFAFILLFGLFVEWANSALDWTYWT